MRIPRDPYLLIPSNNIKRPLSVKSIGQTVNEDYDQPRYIEFVGSIVQGFDSTILKEQVRIDDAKENAQKILDSLTVRDR